MTTSQFSQALRLAFCTCPDREVAERLATMLVSERLAACVNIIPSVTSIYLWQEQLQHDTEWLLSIKTTAECCAQLSTRLQQEHPYDVPELIFIPIVDGLANYLQWVAACTQTHTSG
jgi:periplasmic divalent cation tolerance protein